MNVPAQSGILLKLKRAAIRLGLMTAVFAAAVCIFYCFYPFVEPPWRERDWKWRKSFVLGQLSWDHQLAKKHLLASLESSIGFPSQDPRRVASFRALAALARALPDDDPSGPNGWVAASDLIRDLEHRCHSLKLENEAGCKAVKDVSDWEATIPW